MFHSIKPHLGRALQVYTTWEKKTPDPAVILG